MKYLTNKQYNIIFFVVIGWTVLYLIFWKSSGIIMTLPIWIFIGYQILHLRHIHKKKEKSEEIKNEES